MIAQQLAELLPVVNLGLNCATLLTLGAVAFKAGRWAGRIERDVEELKGAPRSRSR